MSILNSHLEKLIDWKGFELFVAELYRDGSEVIVQHNLTEHGKSGAKRQIDVNVIQKTKFHSLRTIIECKYWKEKVDRGIVDIMFAAVEDLNASKGVIFTTKGYEEGALQYAKSKNIDIFIVRDILEEEWGKLGSKIFLYVQMFCSNTETIQFKHSKFISLNGQPPLNKQKQIELNITKDYTFNDEYVLYAIPGLEEGVKDLQTELIKGPNFLKLLLDVQKQVLETFKDSFNHLAVPEDKTHEFAYRTKVNINFLNYPYRFFPFDNGFTELENVSFSCLQTITQNKILVDRTASSDFMLMIENYITKQKHFVSKNKDANDIKIVGPIIPNENRDTGDFTNGSIIKVTMDYYVKVELNPSTIIQERGEVTVNLIETKGK